MGRWIAEEFGKITSDTSAFLGRANGDEEARALCKIHNADCDAYEARIAELESDRDSETRWACQYKAERDALEAERDGWKDKERVTSELFEAACNDLGAAQERIAALEAKLAQREKDVMYQSNNYQATHAKWEQSQRELARVKAERDSWRATAMHKGEEVQSLRYENALRQPIDPDVWEASCDSERRKK